MACKRKIELETQSTLVWWDLQPLYGEVNQQTWEDQGNIMDISRSILDGYFNPPIFCYQWDYLRSPAKNLSLFAGYLRLALLFIGGFYIPS